MHKKRVPLLPAANGVGHEVTELLATWRANGVISFTSVVGGGSTLTTD